MQSYDSRGEVVTSRMVEAYSDLSKELDRPGVEFVKVGKFPSVGDEAIVNGLRYIVIMRNPKKKRITLELG